MTNNRPSCPSSGSFPLEAPERPSSFRLRDVVRSEGPEALTAGEDSLAFAMLEDPQGREAAFATLSGILAEALSVIQAAEETLMDDLEDPLGSLSLPRQPPHPAHVQPPSNPSQSAQGQDLPRQ